MTKNNYMNKKLLTSSLYCALGTAVYIVLLVLFMNSLRFFSGKEDGVFAPMIALTLLVISAAITGGLVLGKPVMMYIDGAKKDAVKHFASTVVWLFAFLVVFLVIFAVR